MLYNAKSSEVIFDNTVMEYVSFGQGDKNLVILPGLGDGLRSVKGTALPMAILYRIFAPHYKVYVLSRKRELEAGCSTRDMARHQKEAMDKLGIDKADVIGVSMGGMIAQQLAIEHPEKVNKLVIVVSSSRLNPILRESLEEWLACVERNDHKELMRSNLKRIYSEEYCRRNSWLVPFIAQLTKPRSYERFKLQANAVYTHNAYRELHKIKAPCYIIAGRQDKCLGAEASREMAEEISGAELFVYPQWGHGLYDEAKDFNARVLEFLLKNDK